MAITNVVLAKSSPIPSPTGTSLPTQGSIFTFDVTLGATSDYGASGIDLTSTAIVQGAQAAAAGLVPVSQIAHVMDASVRTSGGTLRSLSYKFDATNKTLRLFRSSNTLFANAVQRQNQTNVLTAPLSANAFTLAANTLNANGQALRFRCGGARAAVANTAKIELLVGGTIAQPPVGGTIIGTLTGTANAVATNWVLDTIIHRTGAATQQVQATGSMAVDNSGTLTNAVFTNKFSTQTFDLTTALTIMPTLTGTNTNDITVEWQTAELINVAGTNGVEVVAANDLAAGDIVRITAVCL